MPGAVAAIEGEVVAWAADPVAEHHVAPPHLPGDRRGIGIEQQFVWVEAMPGGGIVRPMHAIAIELVGPHLRQIAVPYLVGVIGEFDARLLVLPGPVEQAQLDLFGMGREQREIDALAVPRRAERIRQPGPHLGGWHQNVLVARLRRMGGAMRNPSLFRPVGSRWVALRSTHPTDIAAVT